MDLSFPFFDGFLNAACVFMNAVPWHVVVVFGAFALGLHYIFSSLCFGVALFLGVAETDFRLTVSCFRDLFFGILLATRSLSDFALKYL
jgi:hypothetical protein